LFEVLDKFKGDTGKLKAFTGPVEAKQYEDAYDMGFDVFCHSKATKAEWYTGKALLSARKDKAKERIQQYIADFTKATRRDAKDWFSDALWTLVAEVLGLPLDADPAKEGAPAPE
jgi:hypothetical protein